MLANYVQNTCQKIISGGQTGVDRGALDACLEQEFPCGGWCPKGRIAEDGIIEEKYPLQETDKTDYASRTRKNVADSDGTLILFHENIAGGTKLTLELALNYNKPLLTISDKEKGNNIIDILNWIVENNIVILNVAGPRKSEWETGYQFARKLIANIIKTRF